MGRAFGAFCCCAQTVLASDVEQTSRILAAALHETDAHFTSGQLRSPMTVSANDSDVRYKSRKQ